MLEEQVHSGSSSAPARGGARGGTGRLRFSRQSDERADARQVVTAIFRKPFAQMALGVLVGTLFRGNHVISELFERLAGMREGALIAGYAAFMMGFCMLSCIVPTRRALRIEPTEALRADG